MFKVFRIELLLSIIQYRSKKNIPSFQLFKITTQMCPCIISTGMDITYITNCRSIAVCSLWMSKKVFLGGPQRLYHEMQ